MHVKRMVFSLWIKWKVLALERGGWGVGVEKRGRTCAYTSMGTAESPRRSKSRRTESQRFICLCVFRYELLASPARSPSSLGSAFGALRSGGGS